MTKANDGASICPALGLRVLDEDWLTWIENWKLLVVLFRILVLTNVVKATFHLSTKDWLVLVDWHRQTILNFTTKEKMGILVEAAEINAKANVLSTFLWNNDNWMKPYGRTSDMFNDPSLDLDVDFLFKRFEVCIWNVTESSGTTWLSIWSEFNLGRFSSHATDLVSENVWVLAGDFIKF